ncbi:helix-turn-helix domain-containing protein [Stenotrophomonas rhizophila]|uniref:helix-turn-helix domain-containing protein n=1 Tax=Stenotrophomonas rhizophila TaxID=216778 RepID=UPI00201CED91|nr:ImmA/IrrE family metallo-endopeptidase [Stenotrophomonas rhizophila]UQY89295.1 helix-turn-helix domain-containing protein [Stenotrophomonas rhizophila]
MFNPARLKLARDRRQLTKKALADLAGVSQLTLTRLETGRTPEPERSTVASLAKALGFPPEFFFLDDYEPLTSSVVSFRSLQAMTSRQEAAALASGSLALQLLEWITARFNLPAPDLLNLRGEEPVAAAMALRTYWGIGMKPIGPLLKLLEVKGVRLFSLAERHKNVDAFSCWRDGTPMMFLNGFKSAERGRFDAAHELGHLVLHAHCGASGRDAEREADRFAAAFLMPQDDLISQISPQPSLEILIRAKSRWGVSLAALVRNCYEAKLISEWHYRDMYRTLSIAGYRTKEPAPLIREQSVLWKKIFESLWRDRITKDQVAKELAFPADVIQDLIGGLCDSLPSEEDVPQPKRPVLRIV